MNFLENILNGVKGGSRALVLGTALFAGAAGLASADDIDYNQKYFFEANYWEDAYGDNNIHDWNQYKGIKQTFRDTEDIILVGHDPSWLEGDQVQWVLYGPGGKVESETFLLKSNGEWYHAGESSDEDIMLDLMASSNGGDGDYTVVWYRNGDQDGSSSFTVSP